MILCRRVFVLVAAASLSCLSWAGSPETMLATPGAACTSALEQATHLTFKQKTCIYTAKTFTASFVLKTALFSGMAQLRNAPHEKDQDFSDYGHRFGTRLAQGFSRNTADYLVGSLNHEDPRLRTSGKSGYWRRAESAFTGVMVAQTDDGSVRPAFSHIAGALSSGFVGAACYRPRHNGMMADGLERSGFAYSTYFARALFAEFRPELMGMTSHLFSKKR